MFSKRVACSSWMIYLLLMPILSQTDTTQQSVILTESSGIIVSPGYPGHYPSNAAFNWSIHLPEKMNLEFSIYNLSIELSELCKLDSLTIYQSEEITTLIALTHPMCGDRCFSVDDPGCKVHAIGQHFFITFVSDATVSKPGFRLVYKDHDAVIAEICNGMHENMSSNSGYIRLGLHMGIDENYTNISCEWTITAPPGQYLVLEVIHFDLKYSGDSCHEDYLELTFRFQYNLLPETTRYCGRRHYWQEGVHRQISEITVRFRGDPVNDNDYAFELFYKHISSFAGYPIDFETLRLSSDNNETTKPSLIGVSCTDTSSYCETMLLIQTDIGDRVRLTLHRSPMTATALSQGLLQIYDGVTNNSVNIITENHRKPSGDVLVYSSGHYMFILVQLELKYITLLQHFNISLASESVFINRSTKIQACTMSNYRLSQTREHDTRKLTFTGDSPGQSTFCISQFQFNVTKSLQISTRQYISEAANVNGCIFEGIVLYVDEVSEANMIGPFCEIRRHFVESVLNKLVLTSRVFFFYLYSYTVAQSNSSPSLIEIMIEETSCNGIRWTVLPHLLLKTTLPLNESDKVIVQTEDAYHVFFSENGLFIEDECSVISIQNLQLDHPSKPIRIYSNGSLQICLYSSMDRTRSNESISEVCENAENGSLVGLSPWLLARIQKGKSVLACPYSTVCTSQELSSDCGSIDLLPMFNNKALEKPCIWILHRGNMMGDKLHHFRIYIEIFKGLQLKIDEFFDDLCEANSQISLDHLPFDVAIESGVRDYEYKTIGAFCTILIFKYRIPDRSDVLIAHYSLQKYQIPKYNATEDAVYVNQKRYTRHRIESNYRVNNERCQNLSPPGYLVSINSREELDQLKLALGTVWRADKPDRMAIVIGLTDAVKWREFRWADGNPLIFTDWYSVGSVEHTLPFTLRVDDEHEKMFGPNFGEIIEPQPAYNMATRCVIMIIGNPHYSTNWVKEDCEEFSDLRIGVSYYICESDSEMVTNVSIPNAIVSMAPPITGQSRINQHPSSGQVQTNISCLGMEGNWYVLNDSCVLLKGYPYVYADFAIDNAAYQCGGIESVFILNADNLELVIDYLQALDHTPGYGAIWVRHNQTGTACLKTSGQIPGERILGDRWKLSTECHTVKTRFLSAFEEDDRQLGCTNNLLGDNITEIRGNGTTRSVLYKQLVETSCFPRNVLCLRPPEDLTHGVPSCTHYQFMCTDGMCLSPDSVCDGYHDCIGGEDEKACKTHDTMFVCNDESVIPISKYCDFQTDCPDGEDESNCEHVTLCRLGGHRLCRNKQCARERQFCDGFYDCIDHSDEDDCNSEKLCQKTRAFVCSSGHCISRALADDTVADCPDSSDTKSLRETPYGMETRCTSNKANYFERTELCIYEDIYDGNCRDSSHLLNCEKFICPWGYFKCTASYCLPIRKVCDGKWDCMDGEDELNCASYTCPGLLRCGGSKNCLSALDVANGRMDCPSDQSDMKYRYTWDCPPGCHCHGYIFNCSSGNITNLPNIQPEARVIILENNSVKIDNATFVNFPYLAILNLNDNNLTLLPIDIFKMQHNLLKLYLRGNNIARVNAGTFRNLGQLEYLDIRGNPLKIIYTDTFRGLTQLARLNISRSVINTIQKSAFRGLNSLKDLDLSFNRIEYIETGAFVDLRKLDSVNLTGNSLTMVPPEVFEEIHTRQLYTSSFRFCCFAAKATNCLPNKDTFSTCNDLMGNSFLRITIWITGVLSVSGNIIVVIWRLVSGLDSVGLVFICNLAMSDFLIGIYLIVLGSFDLHYRGEYIIHDVAWREGVACKIIGFIATLSSQMSLFLLVCITTDRFWKIVYPLSPKSLSMRRAWIVCGIGWSFAVLICALPFSVYGYFGDFYGRNSVCMPYNFSPILTSGWQYALTMFIVPDTVACIYMIIAYIIMFRRISQSRKRSGLNTEDSEITMARKLFLIVITDLICWMPIIISSLGAYMGLTLNADTVAFLAVLILPINGAVNPYLYTLTNFRKRAKKADSSIRRTTQTNVS